MIQTFQIVKMFGAVTGIFGVCWLPYHTYFMYSFYNPSIMRAWYTPHMFLAFYWLAMVNSCVNPLVYYAMNQRYQVIVAMVTNFSYLFTPNQMT